MPVNHAFRLASRPEGQPTRANFEFVEEPAGEPESHEVLVRVLYISLDPAMRGWMSGKAVGIGDVMRAFGVGRVQESNHPDYPPGGYVFGSLGVQEYAIVPGGALTPIDPDLAPVSMYLSALGLPGLRAYFGLLHLGRPESGQTVVVSGAAGAAGHIAGQIAKLRGARVVGLARGPERCGYIVEELGFDEAIDYEHEDVAAGLREHCPQGIDVYFDNVGGETLDAALGCLARHARIVICGAVSPENSTEGAKGPANYVSLMDHHASMTGFLVTDYAQHFPAGRRALAGWLASGELRSSEHILDGLETFPDALIKLFIGDHVGRLMLRVAED